MQVGAQQVALVGTVVLDLLAVAAVAHFLAVELLQRDGGDHGQRDALVGRAEHHVEVQAEVIMDGLGVVLAQTMQLLSRDVRAGVHEERGLAAALQREAAELQNMALHHEVDELFLILLHEIPFRKETGRGNDPFAPFNRLPYKVANSL